MAMIKMVNKAGRLTEGAKKAFKGAHIAGGDDEMILIPGGYANDKVWRRLASLTCDLDINLYSFNEDAYVIRDFFERALENLSQPAFDEFVKKVMA